MVSDRLQISVLGEFTIVYDAVVITEFNRPRLQALLTYLVLHAGTPLARAYLAFLFWPDSSEKQALTNLRRQIHLLRRLLPEVETYLQIDARNVMWRVDAPFTADLTEYKEWLKEADVATLANDTDGARKALERAIELYGGDLLPDCYDDWVLAPREALRQQFQQVIDQLIDLLEGERDLQASVRYGLRLLQHDPLHEEGYRRLIGLYMLNGDRASALRIYHTCASVLQRELGVPPSPATESAYERLMNFDPERAEQTREGRTSGFDTTLVGRKDEWRQLLASWQAAAGGQSTFVLISGEPGIGKTRLAEELYVWANHKGIDTVRSRSYSASTELAYAPVVEMLRVEPLRSRLSRLEPVWMIELARLLPDLLIEQPELSTPPPLTKSWQRHRLIEALARSLQVDVQPLLLMIDDLQWCDGETLEWLAHLMRLYAKDRLLILATARLEEVSEDQPLTEILYRLGESKQLMTMELERLDAVDTAKLASNVAGRTLSTEEAAQLHRSTQGNPLFVVEMVHEDTLNQGSVVGETEERAVDFPAGSPTIQLPAKVYAVIKARLARLLPSTRDLLSFMAVIGRSFSFELLAAATELDEDQLMLGLDSLWQRKLIREQSAGVAEYAYDFHHDRIRDVVYAEISPIQRRRLHQRVAKALEQVHASDKSAVSSELARHYEQAGDRGPARDYYRVAGQQAADRFVHDDAIRYLTRALEMTGDQEYAELYEIHKMFERVHHTQAARDAQNAELDVLMALADTLDDDVRRGEVYLGRAECDIGNGNYESAVHNVRQAIGYARTARERRLEIDSLVQWGAVLWNRGEYSEAREQYEDALQLARDAGDRKKEEAVLLHMGPLYMYCGTYAEVESVSQQALATARALNDKEGQSWAHNQLAFLIVEHGDGDYAVAESHYEEALRIAQAAGIRLFEVKVLNNLAALCDRIGEYTRGLDCLQQALAIARETESPRQQAFALNYFANCYTNQGDYERALRYYQQALDLFRMIGYRQGEGKTLSEFSFLRYMMGDFALAEELAEQGLTIAVDMNVRRDQAYAHTRRGYALEGQAKWTQAHDAYLASLSIYKETGQRNRSLEPSAGLARMALAQGNIEQAYNYVEEILQRAIQLDATDEAFLVYVTCLRTLRACADPREEVLVKQMYDILERRVGAIDNDDGRRMFWTNVVVHKEVSDLFTSR